MTLATDYLVTEGARDFALPPVRTEQSIDVKEVSDHVMPQANSGISNDVIQAAEINESLLETDKADPQTDDVDIVIQHQEHQMPGQFFHYQAYVDHLMIVMFVAIGLSKYFVT